MRWIVASLLTVGFFTVAGCDGRSSLSPTTVTIPVPSVPAQLWNLTTVITAIVGPDNCFTQRQFELGVPRSLSWLMSVTQTGNEVTFDYDIRNRPTDDVLETGTVDGDAFKARSAASRVGFPACADGTVLTGTVEANLEGRFAADRKHLTATEAVVYHFSSGDVTVLLDWSADQF